MAKTIREKPPEGGLNDELLDLVIVLTKLISTRSTNIKRYGCLNFIGRLELV
jgi:hypothetical protein